MRASWFSLDSDVLTRTQIRLIIEGFGRYSCINFILLLDKFYCVSYRRRPTLDPSRTGDRRLRLAPGWYPVHSRRSSPLLIVPYVQRLVAHRSLITTHHGLPMISGSSRCYVRWASRGSPSWKASDRRTASRSEHQTTMPGQPEIHE